MEKKYKVYKITNTKNGNFYIGYTGLSLEKRFRCHANVKNQKYPIAKAFNKYGKDSFIIEELKTFLTKKEACNYEIKMIAELSPSYNAHFGGTGGAQYGVKNSMYGKHHTLEWKLKRRNDMKGIKNPMYGKTHTLAARQKIRESKIGKIPWNKGRKNIYDEIALLKMKQPKTEEHRKNLSKFFSFVSPTGEIVKVFGLLNFCKINNLSAGAMSEVYRGKRNHHKGWKSNHTKKE